MTDTDDRIASSLAEVRETVARIDATLPHLATKAELAEVRSDIVKLEVKLIKWLVSTVVATGVTIVVALSAQLWAAMRLLHG